MMMLKVTAGLLLFHVAIIIIIKAQGAQEYSKADFPSDFIFGSGSSAYQVEGAAFEDGRTPTIFDTLAHAGNYGDGDTACDEYHKYKEDVQLMADTGLQAYRFSISWSRLIPHGRGPVNPKGLEYYNNLINDLLRHGIEPHVTLMHLDVPQALEDEYQGWLNRRVIEDFKEYADVCFREFGDRVKYWLPVNEANMFVFGGYDLGGSPPGRCSSPFGTQKCANGNSTIEPYIAGHHVLLAHAWAVHLYRTKYQETQKGFIGFNVYASHFAPVTNTKEDVNSAKRSYDFFIGWFMEPLIYGDYPEIMKKNVGKRLPKLKKYESDLVKGSFDFVGLNYYYVTYTKENLKSLNMKLRDLSRDMAALWIGDSTNVTSGALPVAPWGLQAVMEYFKQTYGNPPIYIHENGQRSYHTSSLNDTSRVEYMQAHIGSVLDAIRNGSNAKGYFSWSFLDMYELLGGNKFAYGHYYVDWNDPNLTRHPKLSQHWYSGFLKGKRVTIDAAPNAGTLNMDKLKLNEYSMLIHSQAYSS